MSANLDSFKRFADAAVELSSTPNPDLSTRNSRAHRIFESPLSEPAPWRGLRFDLHHAELHDFSLANCVIDDCTFNGATFAGDCALVNVHLRGHTDFTNVKVRGSLQVRGMCELAYLHMDGLVVEPSATLIFDGVFSGRESAVDIAFAKIAGTLDIRVFAPGSVTFGLHDSALSGTVL